MKSDGEALYMELFWGCKRNGKDLAFTELAVLIPLWSVSKDVASNPFPFPFEYENGSTERFP